MDNYYNSILLAAKLLSKETYCTGTLRVDRKYIPADIKADNLTMGGTITRYGEGIMVGKWKDQRAIVYLSTEHENDMVTVINKRKVKVLKPLPIVKYNGFMKGVDRSDQMQAYYPMERKTLQWSKKMFIHTIQMMIVNAYYLFNKTFQIYRRKMGLHEFTESVKDDLLPDIPAVTRPLPRPTGHMIMKIAKKMGNTNRISSKKCCMCKKSTQYKCLACLGQTFWLVEGM
uniref:PiggyBac transposable element-derived protein domain-containing protein n=2 Tax=Clastoptera arizonana TaxID=38151 RepID=A0A1B6E2D2_9HEMI